MNDALGEFRAAMEEYVAHLRALAERCEELRMSLPRRYRWLLDHPRAAALYLRLHPRSSWNEAREHRDYGPSPWGTILVVVASVWLMASVVAVAVGLSLR